VLGWVWSTDKTFYDAYDHATYHTLPSHVQHFDGQVVPQKRGRGFAFVGFPLMWHHWHRRGFRQSVCVISTKNRPSLRTHQRLGYTEIGRMTMHWCLGHRWITTDTEFVSSGDKTRRG
jgi:predicted GNAT superfamily acetyltransferase